MGMWEIKIHQMDAGWSEQTRWAEPEVNSRRKTQDFFILNNQLVTTLQYSVYSRNNILFILFYPPKELINHKIVCNLASFEKAFTPTNKLIIE